MSTLGILGVILALFAVILIPLMMMKPQQDENLDPSSGPGNHGKRPKKKKKR